MPSTRCPLYASLSLAVLATILVPSASRAVARHGVRPSPSAGGGRHDLEKPPKTALTALRLDANPILTPQSASSLGTNLNGPSLVRVPDWVEHPLGRYYLYFAHHKGSFIRLAYADRPAGPWRVYEPGALKLSDAPACVDHIASPDVHVDAAGRRLRMYFHCSTDPGDAENSQRTFLATSEDGVHFTAAKTPLGPYYFRVFRWGGYHYAIARGGTFLRSPDGLAPFEPGPSLFSGDPRYVLRHAAVDLRGNILSVYYSRIGDCPERILVSQIRLTRDWTAWRASAPQDVIRPEMEYEGGRLPLRPSEFSLAPGPVRELRDPAIFRERNRTYLLYSIAGESGLAIAELRTR